LRHGGVAAFIGIDRIAADGEITVSFRRDQPPDAVDFLQVKMSPRLEFSGGEAAAEPVEFRRVWRGFRQEGRFFGRIVAQLVVGLDFAWPFLIDDLPVTVHRVVFSA
jgi:hypothetical protein